MAKMVVSVVGVDIICVIPRAEAEEMGLKPGDAVTAVIKSSEVMIRK